MPKWDRLELEAEARRHLSEQLGQRAPEKLVYEGKFEESPLAGEGSASVFSFLLASSSGRAGCASTAESVAPNSDAPDARHFVVVGDTRPNYFPGYGLNVDDAYSFHIGTRFAVDMRLGLTGLADEPADARHKLQSALDSVAAGSRRCDPQLEGVFRVDVETYCVYRLSFDGKDVFAVGGDLPVGFYELTQWPPQVALRLHLGKLIRTEENDAVEADSG